MVRNLSREFATMSDEERKRFELERGGTTGGPENEPAGDELEFGNPRRSDTLGPTPDEPPHDEHGDPERRDGYAALVDDEQHARGAKDAKRKPRGKSE